jgi:hypothetical protein
MKQLTVLVPLLAVALALPASARSQRTPRPDSPLTHILEFGKNRAVLASDIRYIGSTTLMRQFVEGRDTVVRETYEVELPVGSVTPILSEFFSSDSLPPRRARVYGLAADGAVRTVRSFANALFTEVQFPVLDANSKSTGRVTVRFEAEAATESLAPDRIEIRAPEEWQTGNFRVEIGSLPCTTVSKVEAVTVRRTGRKSSQWEVSNLVLTMSMRDIDPWTDWARDFMIVGNAGPEFEFSGSIEYLDASLMSGILKVDFAEIGIINLQPLTMEANQETIARFTVELYGRPIRVS